MEGIGILHGELAHAQHAPARSGFVPELGLDLVHHDGQVTVAVDGTGHQIGHDLLVRHGQAHVAAGPVLHPHQIVADCVPAAGLAPQFRRQCHRHHHLLTIHAVHLLAQKPFDLVLDPHAQRQVLENPGGYLAHQAGPEHQLVADQFRLGRRLAQRVEKQFGHPHGKRFPVSRFLWPYGPGFTLESVTQESAAGRPTAPRAGLFGEPRPRRDSGSGGSHRPKNTDLGPVLRSTRYKRVACPQPPQLHLRIRGPDHDS